MLLLLGSAAAIAIAAEQSMVETRSLRRAPLLLLTTTTVMMMVVLENPLLRTTMKDFAARMRAVFAEAGLAWGARVHYNWLTAPNFCCSAGDLRD